MSRTVIVRYTTSNEAAAENQRRIEDVFAELAATGPEGLQYTSLRLADGVTFVHVAQVEGDDNPLTRSAAFAAFQAGISQRCVEQPVLTEATVVGSYHG